MNHATASPARAFSAGATSSGSPSSGPGQPIILRQLPGPNGDRTVRQVSVKPVTVSVNSKEAEKLLKELFDEGVVPQQSLLTRLIRKVDGNDLSLGKAMKLAASVQQRSESPARRGPVLVEANPKTKVDSASEGDGKSTAVPKLETFFVDTKAADQLFDLIVHERDPIGHAIKGKDTIVKIKGPAALDRTFYDHIARADSKAKNATGHVRASHDPNAFPRTWSLEKIGRAVKAVLEANNGKLLEKDSGIRFKPTHVFDGLPITLFYTEVDAKYRVRTAFVAYEVSAGDAENRQVDDANALLGDIENPALAKLFKDHLAKENIWNTLALAEKVAQDSEEQTLCSEDVGRLTQVKDLLCLGETRLPSHRKTIDEIKGRWEAKSTP